MNMMGYYNRSLYRVRRLPTQAHLPTYLTPCLCTYLSTNLPALLPAYLLSYLPLFLPNCFPSTPPVYPPHILLTLTHIFVCIYVCVSVLQDYVFLHFCCYVELFSIKEFPFFFDVVTAAKIFFFVCVHKIVQVY